jgi:predicted  nucleic acid-binding Zn-ribbon protein
MPDDDPQVTDLLRQIKQLTDERDTYKRRVETVLLAGAESLAEARSDNELLQRTCDATAALRGCEACGVDKLAFIAMRDKAEAHDALKAQLETAEAFHRVAVKERDYERTFNERLRAEVAQLELDKALWKRHAELRTLPQLTELCEAAEGYRDAVDVEFAHNQPYAINLEAAERQLRAALAKVQP